MTVFNTELNSFCRKYLIQNQNEDKKSLALTFSSEYVKAKNQIIEQLLFFDKIAFNVYGENLVLVVLINELGLNQVLELIEENVIEFLLWTPLLLTTTNDDLIGKINPLVSGNANTPVHCDPKESIQMGLRSLKSQPGRKERRALERKVEKIYKIPDQRFVHNAAEIVTSAHNTNKLVEFGLPKVKEAIWLNLGERNKLLKVGNNVLESTILSEFKYSSFGKYETYSLTRQSFECVKNAAMVLDGAREILKTEQLPNVADLISVGKITITELVKFRRKSTSRKFRTWLAENSPGESGDIVKEYIDEIANHKGFFETNKGKFVKTMGMWGIGGSIGNVLGGVQGSIYGVAAASLLQPTAELGLSLIDTYFLENFLKGWQPKLFINEYEKLKKENGRSSN